MTRFSLLAVLATGILLVPFIPRAEAQSPYQRAYRSPRVATAAYAQPKKVVIDPNQRKGTPQPLKTNGAPLVVLPEQPGYVQLDAPLYPVPRPNIPYQVGATMITNQALAPHEFLYPHTYRALYPPYYYRVRGHWWGAFGSSKAHEKWELQGTEVEVKYSSHIPLKYRNPFAGLID